MLIRKATLDDMEILLQFEQGVVNAERPFDATLKPANVKYYDLYEFITSPDIEMLVAEDDGVVVGGGYARIKEIPEPYFDFTKFAYLGFMYVSPGYRGRGVNQMIIEELKKWSLSRGLTELRLQVYNGNEGAIKAYEKTGFEKHMIVMRMRLEE